MAFRLFKKKSGVTAKELMDRLNSDPAYVARKKEKSEAHAQKVASNTRFVADLLRDLAEAGCKVDSLEQLQRNKETYLTALPVLLRTFAGTHVVAFKTILLSHFCSPWSGLTATPLLIDEFKKADTESLRWAIGNALNIIADDSSYDSIVQLACDTRYGKAREMVTLALGDMKNPVAMDILRQLLKDEVVCGYAVMALGKLKAHQARSDLVPFLSHEKPWIRAEATKALKRLDAHA